MKCRAALVLQDERTEQVTKMYGTKALEAMQSEAALLLLDGFPWFRRAGLKTFFDGQAGNCSKELNDNAPDRIYIKDRRGRHEADELMRFETVVDDAEYMLGRRMNFAGSSRSRYGRGRRRKSRTSSFSAPTGSTRTHGSPGTRISGAGQSGCGSPRGR